MTEALRAVLARAEAVLFDFDGPVCSVFAGYPAPKVAADLRAHLELVRPGTAWTNAGRSDDPMRVIIDAPTWGADFAAAADDRLTELETQAVASAAPTPGGAESMRACRASGRTLALVTNNSARAAAAYVAQHHLGDLLGDRISGRRHGRPELMKPHPASIETALRMLEISPAAAVLVGDSLTDVIGARNAGIMCIGFADKPGKVELLADADVVIDDMRALAEQLRNVPAPR